MIIAKLLLAALATVPAVPAQTAHAGSTCSFGDARSGAIGMPNGATDIPGINGNEVNQIYRIFYVGRRGSREETGFAGWLYASFDGKLRFALAGPATYADASPLRSLSVHIANWNKMPLGDWAKGISGAGKRSRLVDDLIATDMVQRVASPCFAQTWDGKQ